MCFSKKCKNLCVFSDRAATVTFAEEPNRAGSGALAVRIIKAAMLSDDWMSGLVVVALFRDGWDVLAVAKIVALAPPMTRASPVPAALVVARASVRARWRQSLINEALFLFPLLLIFLSVFLVVVSWLIVRSCLIVSLFLVLFLIVLLWAHRVSIAPAPP